MNKTQNDSASACQDDAKPVPGMALKRPCKECPFRSDSPRYLSDGRYLQLAKDLVDRGASFNCHKTLESQQSTGELVIGDSSKQCAGAMIWLQAQGRPNAMMQVMERLGVWSPDRLDMDAPVFRSRRGFETGSE